MKCAFQPPQLRERESPFATEGEIRDCLFKDREEDGGAKSIRVAKSFIARIACVLYKRDGRGSFARFPLANKGTVLPAEV